MLSFGFFGYKAYIWYTYIKYVQAEHSYTQINLKKKLTKHAIWVWHMPIILGGEERKIVISGSA